MEPKESQPVPTTSGDWHPRAQRSGLWAFRRRVVLALSGLPPGHPRDSGETSGVRGQHFFSFMMFCERKFGLKLI